MDQSSCDVDCNGKTYKMKEMQWNKVINVSIVSFMVLSAAIEIFYQIDPYKESSLCLAILNLVLLLIYLAQFVFLHYRMNKYHNFEYQS